MAIKSAISNVDKTFNDNLFVYFCSKDDVFSGQLDVNVTVLPV